jgi:hypothetical protein
MPQNWLVVDELVNGAVGAADRALVALTQLQFAELHVERVVEHEAADQRLALAENELSQPR